MSESITRRRLLYGTLSFAAIAAAGGLVPVRAGALTLTPEQTAGPFYPVKLPLDADNDLVQVQGRPARALGTVTHVLGRVRDAQGRPLPQAQVEIWQCDARGVYLHPADRGQRDENFQGYGQTLTDAAGAYRFRTIRPVPYPGRTPHIHFKVTAPGHHPLTTQMYVAGERQNAQDFVYSSIDSADARASVTVALEAASTVESGALLGVFEIVVG
jgi:protocatechuate 3,4-dioxygenase beta subunit